MPSSWSSFGEKTPSAAEDRLRDRCERGDEASVVSETTDDMLRL